MVLARTCDWNIILAHHGRHRYGGRVAAPKGTVSAEEREEREEIAEMRAAVFILLL
jgi:hypothetical protein